MPDILHRVGVNAPLQPVYRMLSRPEGVSRWWTRKVTGTAELGGTLELRFKNDSLIMHMRVEELRGRRTGAFRRAIDIAVLKTRNNGRATNADLHHRGIPG